ncbi:MAG: endolytic transglycosylase MltG [Rhodothermia bacterium]|nr:endolytic transglycosylase MltG [Rhodothermia bacterium]
MGIAVVWAVILYAVAFSPNTANYDGERSVLIPPETSMEVTADSLLAADILRFRSTFTLLARATGWGNQIKAGHFLIPAGASNYDILDKLRKGLQSPIRVTIPPGSRPEVVAAVAAKSMAFEADDFLRALRDTTLARSVGTDTTHLFGFMLPETYFFYWLTDANKVVTTIKNEFDRRYRQYAAEEGNPADLSPEDAATIASIVEWETSIVEEKPTVAGVYLNRLRNGWRLDADPTVQYAILEREGSKRRLFFRDYRIQHPYNTYLFRGLPPGPVTNPSPSSLRAVLGPESHRYFYFVARGDGGHIFSRTLAEHNRNANAYRRLMRERRAQQGG